MRDICEAVARGLSTKVGFYFGDLYAINAEAKDETSDVIVCLLPYSKNAKALRPGTTKSEYDLNLLFLKKSDLDLNFDSREDSFLTPMETLADEFFHKLKDYIEKEINPKVEPVTGYRQLIDQINEFDLNMDGTLLNVKVPRSLDFNYCLNNYTFTISSDGSAVANSITWLHDVSEVSADGSTFGATASFSGTGWTLDINAGSETTGSYTFTPSVNADYTFKRRLWVKWSDDVITPMNVKIVYSYTP